MEKKSKKEKKNTLSYDTRQDDEKNVNNMSGCLCNGVEELMKSFFFLYFCLYDSRMLRNIS